ncbi:McrC family protein [Maribacter stanieri]|uniref:McrC family protein n=1 Tax=Maribacter stanieri TaxID=440514 RepID=UPI0024952DC6|nr:restriction endonuclease [Maribacter stanieri]
MRYNVDSDFKKQHFDAMVHFNEKNHNKYFTVIQKGVQFKNYVGVVQIGGLTIEILPKVDYNEMPDENLWQGVLLNMLKICKHINVDNVSETALKKRYNSILEVYYAIYLNEIENLIKRGLVRKYRRIKSNQLALKGKLVFTQNIQKNLVHKERFYCEHQIYDGDHLIHQILFKGLTIFNNLLNGGLNDKLNRVMFEFNDFKELNITASHFKRISINRKNKPYQRAIEIAKMLILNYSPNLNSGGDNMLTLLFDMNKLWEEYVLRILQKHKPNNTTISFQNKQEFWKSNSRTKAIKPDIVVTVTNDEINTPYIIDTKWKIRDSNNPDDSDLKQMFVYNLYWKAERSLLLFPKVNQDDSNFGKYNYLANDMEANKCKLGFISIIDDYKIKREEALCNEILRKLI